MPRHSEGGLPEQPRQYQSLPAQKSLFDDNPIVHRCRRCGKVLKSKRSIKDGRCFRHGRHYHKSKRVES